MDGNYNEIVTKVEIDDVSSLSNITPTKQLSRMSPQTAAISIDTDDEDQFVGLPEIIRNQARSRRARAKALARSSTSGMASAESSQSSSMAAAMAAAAAHFGIRTSADTSSCGSSNRSTSPTHAPTKHSSSSSPNPICKSKNAVSTQSNEDSKYYKNMSRERRLIANARERTRVHTISTAFDALRQAIPTYSYNQKLSKLAILRIASSYIKSLTAMTQEPEALVEQTQTDDTCKTAFSQCVADCTKTLQMECRARSRRKGRKE